MSAANGKPAAEAKPATEQAHYAIVSVALMERPDFQALPVGAKWLATVLLSFGWGTGVVTASRRTIAHRAAVCEKTVKRLLAELAAAGLVVREKRSKKGGGTGWQLRLTWWEPPAKERGQTVPGAPPNGKPERGTDRPARGGQTVPPRRGQTVPGAGGQTVPPNRVLERELKTTTKTADPSSSSISLSDSEKTPEAEADPLEPAIRKVREAFPDFSEDQARAKVRRAGCPPDWIVRATELAQGKGKGWGWIVGTLANWKAEGGPSLPGKARKAPPPTLRPYDRAGGADPDREPLPLDAILPLLDGDKEREALKGLEPDRQRNARRMASQALDWDPSAQYRVIRIWDELHRRLLDEWEAQHQPAPTSEPPPAPAKSRPRPARPPARDSEAEFIRRREEQIAKLYASHNGTPTPQQASA